MVTSIYEALRLLGPGEGQAPGDQELLDRYRRGGDDGAFATLLRRHGGMVWGVCRRLLPRRQDAEDAFQATFLVFARKAASIGRGHLLGNWLYGVAYRTALRARRSAARWASRRAPLLDEPAAADAERCDLPALIDEELSRLPEKYRVPVVLCCLEGMTKEEAARSAGVPEGTLSSRLARGRDLLRRRLTRRGVACTAPPVAALLAGGTAFAAAPPLLSAAVAGSSASPAALELTEGVLRAMWIYRLKVVFLSLVACLALVGAGAVVLGAASAEPLPQGGAQQPPRPGVFPAAPKGPAVNPAPVPFGRQWQGAFSGQEQPLRAILRSEAEWRKLWEVLHAPVVGKPPLPKVDFTKEMLVAVALGQRTSGGYAVTITRIVQTPEGLTAYVRETKPKPFTPVEGVLTNPYHVVAVPMFRGKVAFLDEPGDKAGAGKGQKATPVAIAWQWDGQFAEQQLPLRTAVRTQAEWQKLWRLAQGKAKPLKPAPKVDFTRNMILAAFMGERPCPGFNVRITHVLKSDRGLTVHVRESEPPADAFDKQVVTSPCHFALVPAVKGEVTFVDEGNTHEAPAPGPGPAPRVQAPKEVRVERQWEGQNAAQEKPAREAIRTQKDWDRVWKAAEGNVIPMPPVPKVDFSRQMVLAVFMGQCNTGGFAVQVTRVVRTDKGLTAYVRETRPGPGDIVTQAITSPFHFVVVPADKGPVTFENEPAAGK